MGSELPGNLLAPRFRNPSPLGVSEFSCRDTLVQMNAKAGIRVRKGTQPSASTATVTSDPEKTPSSSLLVILAAGWWAFSWLVWRGLDIVLNKCSLNSWMGGCGPGCPLSRAWCVSPLMMSIGNQKFGIPIKYRYQIGICYFSPRFLGIFSVSWVLSS